MRRREPGITFEHFRLFTFGSDEELVAAFGSIETAEGVWNSIRDEFLLRWNMWGMPEAWWRFEPGIPAELRSGPAAIFNNADAAKWRSIERARRRYLLSIGIDPISPRPMASGEDSSRD